MTDMIKKKKTEPEDGRKDLNLENVNATTDNCCYFLFYFFCHLRGGKNSRGQHLRDDQFLCFFYVNRIDIKKTPPMISN